MKISIFLIEVLAASYIPNKRDSGVGRWGRNKERVLTREEELSDAKDIDSIPEAIQNKNLFLNLAAEELARNSLTADAEKSIKPNGSVKNLKTDDRNDERR